MSNGFLVDTSVASLFAPARPSLPEMVDQWLIERQSQFYLPTIAVAEMQQGIGKLRIDKATFKVRAFESWLKDLLVAFEGRILPLDVTVARHVGELSAFATSKGRHPGFPDIAIAATAQVYGLTS